MKLLMLLAPIVLFPTETPKVEECIQPHYVVKVEVDLGRQRDVGSGALIRHNLIVTGEHVARGGIKGKKPVYVTFYDGDTIKARVVEYNKAQDIALLRIDKVDIDPVKLGVLDPTEGEKIIIYGWANGTDMMRLSSRVHDFYTFKEGSGSKVFSVLGSTISGMSGGPAVNQHGVLMGIMVGADKKESYCPNISNIKTMIKGFDNRKKKR